MYICVTEVDAKTKIPCTIEPQRNGPSLPNVKGLEFKWADKSTWPVDVAPDGTYMRSPKYYCVCDNDADINISGVLEVLLETDWIALEIKEKKAQDEKIKARKPYPSWIYYPDTQTYSAPIPRPANAVINGGNVRYKWDESILNWTPIENQS